MTLYLKPENSVYETRSVFRYRSRRFRVKPQGGLHPTAQGKSAKQTPPWVFPSKYVLP